MEGEVKTMIVARQEEENTIVPKLILDQFY